ncbi:hypothetical protein FQA39_LY03176 [Lamprigera yunnana]|nr:hypothetical protein FQA39_LY03176 [Lamprigera yunnana]
MSYDSKKERKISNENDFVQLLSATKYSSDPKQVDLEIQKQRILTVLDAVIDKMKLAVCLPALLESKSSLLQKYLTQSDYEFMRITCAKLNLATSTAISFEFPTDDNILMQNARVRVSNFIKRQVTFCSLQNKTIKTHKFVDLQIKQVMEILCRNPRLKEYIQKNYKCIVEKCGATLIHHFNTIREIATKKLSVSAISEIDRDKALNRIWNENKDLDIIVSGLERELDEQRKTAQDEVKIRKAIISDVEEKIHNLELDLKEEIRRIVSNTEMTMLEENEISKVRQTDLAIEVKLVQQQCEHLVVQHVAEEKILRSKKIKIEQQLVGWLNKYDADMSERQQELDQITDAYHEEHNELVALEAKFDEQEAIYVELILERDDYRRQCGNEIASEFFLMISARRIQRWWRKILSEGLPKRRVKVKTKKKKPKVL